MLVLKPLSLTEPYLICIKAGLKACRQKVSSYRKVSVVTQRPTENPAAFLERPKEALIKHTNLDLDSYESRVILNNRFLTQLVPGIRRKLQKVVQDSRGHDR